MAELKVDQTEIGVIIMGLTAIEDEWLTEEGRAACTRLAHKLGALAGYLFGLDAETMPDPAPGYEWHRELTDD